MKKKQKTILLFAEQRTAIEYLSDAQAGLLLKAIYAYAEEGTLPGFDGPMMSVFAMIRAQIDRSEEAYKEKCDKNRSNSLKRVVMQGKNTKEQNGNERQPSLTFDDERPPSTSTDTHPNLIPTSIPKPNTNPIPNQSPILDDDANTLIIKTEDMIVGEEYSFDEIWRLYDKPLGNVEALKVQWNALSVEEKKNIFDYVPRYVEERPDRKYRKNFANFLSNRTWETEPINHNNNTLYGNSKNNITTADRKREEACRNAEQLIQKFIESSNAGPDGTEG